MDVLMNDNEENADLAIKILMEILRFYKSTWDALVSHTLTSTNPKQIIYLNKINLIVLLNMESSIKIITLLTQFVY